MITLIKKPGERATRFDLAESARAQLAAMQTVVGGFIETAVKGRDFVVWCNEEGRPLGLPVNFHRPTDGGPIVGSVLVTGPIVSSLDGGIPTALAEESIERIANLLDSWASAGVLCGTAPAHYDPDPGHAGSVLAARSNADRKRFAARVLIADLARKRGIELKS